MQVVPIYKFQTVIVFRPMREAGSLHQLQENFGPIRAQTAERKRQTGARLIWKLESQSTEGSTQNFKI